MLLFFHCRAAVMLLRRYADDERDLRLKRMARRIWRGAQKAMRCDALTRLYARSAMSDAR